MKRIEIEKKFYCTKIDELVNILDQNNLKLISNDKEIDEYFTDVDSVFVENRTCLRIRTTNNKSMEITFKGKSKELSNLYLKSESNISINIDEYDDVVTMFNALGYYSYTKVLKERLTYSLDNNDVCYNVMIDNINDVGNFVELEILTHDDMDKEKLEEMLDSFVSKFKILNLETADIPYRDFVAQTIYKQVLPKKELKAVLFDLDGTLIESEIVFFKSFKEVLKTYGADIDFETYKKYEQKKNAKLIETLKEENKLSKDIDQNEIMEKVYNNYEKIFKKEITKPQAILNFELIKRLKNKGIKVALVTTSKKIFVDMLIEELKLDNLFDNIIHREDVVNHKPAPDAYLKCLNDLSLDKDNCIVLEDAMRGIESSTSIGLKTVNVGELVLNNDLVVNIDLASRLLFILINWI